MTRILSSLPIWVILIDMLYGFALNLSQSWQLSQAHLPKDGLPMSPEIAFSGLQVLANGGMILIVGFGLMVLLRLNRTVLRNQTMPIGVPSTLGLISVLAFSAPALWEWLWALFNLLRGHNTIAFTNPRYLLVACCMPWVALLCIWRLIGWYRLHGKGNAVTPEIAAAPEFTEVSTNKP